MKPCRHDISQQSECLSQKETTEFDCILCIASGFNKLNQILASQLDMSLMRPSDGYNVTLIVQMFITKVDMMKSWIRAKYPKEVV